MAVLFFAMESALEEVAHRVFAALHLTNAATGNSVQVVNSVYSQAAAFGHKLRVEGNCYDYDPTYPSMLSIREDFLAAVAANDQGEELLAAAVALLLKLNLGLAVARERNGQLRVV